jgi:C_GCAxxG_C_C family probable redox protein
MPDYTTLKRKVDELAERKWDDAAIKARIDKMVRDGIPRKRLDPSKLQASRVQILDRVQLYAEENNFHLKNCAQSTALALMEEFGLGSMQIIRALTAFPSIGGTGRICGGITGSLIALGLCFGPENPPDFEKMNQTIQLAQKFITSFEKEIGYVNCADILEKVTLGHRLNPGESEQSMAQFAREKGFEKCGLPPGMGARLAAGFIIASLK